MANKPIKIKRNGSISGKRRQRKLLAKRAFGIALVLGGLLAIGYLGAPAVIELVENISQIKPPLVQPSPKPTPVEEEEVVEETTEDEQEPEIQIKDTVYSYVDRQSLLSEDAITQTAQSLKEKGVNFAVITLKDQNGNIHYDTQTEIGQIAKADVLLDVPTIVSIFKENGVYVTAEIYAFMDKTTPNINRETAVKYVGTDINWWDNSKEFGGKPWANPASEIMQNYLYDITAELSSMGVKEFILSAVQLPTGYSLDKRDFGVSENQLQAQIQGFINTMEVKVEANGSKAFFAFDIDSVNGGDYSKYIVAPYRLGADNIVLVGNNTNYEGVDLNEISDKLIEEGYAEKIVFWNTDENLNENSAKDYGYFVK